MRSTTKFINSLLRINECQLKTQIVLLAKGDYRIQISMALHFFSQCALQLLILRVFACLSSFQQKIDLYLSSLIQIYNVLISWLYMSSFFFSILVCLSFCGVKVEDECINSNHKNHGQALFIGFFKFMYLAR